mmetsp:Transcript_20816/g.52845  ORF Transcript_20816/g.52845 Transcript_20816/m.52845 type:complete len:224 (-) Transcript_20816:252-923(-)
MRILSSRPAAWPTSSKAITTTAAPYRLTIFAFLTKSSSPSLSEIELTMHLPWQHLRPASTMWNLEESIMSGSLEMSGSGMSMLRNFFIAYSPSSRPSSMLTSITCAPDSACARAISSALSYSPLRMSFLYLIEPAMLHRSPTLTKPRFLSMVIGSRPEIRISQNSGCASRGLKGVPAAAASRSILSTAPMCSGVVPQQPPSMLTSPVSRKSLTDLAKLSGVSS